MDSIDDYVRAVMTAEQRRIEWAVERAVQDGKCGVKVMRRDGMLISAEPDESVPYGWIHEHLLPPEPIDQDIDDVLRAMNERLFQAMSDHMDTGCEGC